MSHDSRQAVIDKIISINNNINNMTVQQLIDELNKVEDKSITVILPNWADVNIVLLPRLGHCVILA